MSIEVNDESGEAEVITASEITQLARYVLDYMRVHPQAELAILLVNETAIAELNHRWLGEAKSTDVLAFPMDELRPGNKGALSDPGILGDIVVCPQVAKRQAQAAGHAAAEEILLLITHGILHLLGFDHAEPEEEKEMFALQRHLLLTFLAQR